MEGGSAKDGGQQRLGRLAAIVVALLSLLIVLREVIREGLPWSWWEISLEGAILIGAVVVIGLYIEDHRSHEGRKPLFGQHSRMTTVLLVLAAACAVAGFAVGTERAVSGDQVARADAAPSKRLARVMEKLRRAAAVAFLSAVAQSDPIFYASRARKLSHAFEEAAADLRQVRFHRPAVDLAPLIAELQKLGAGYDRLGNAVLRFDAKPARFEAARRRIKRLGRNLHRAEEELRDSGLAIASPL